MVNLYTSPDLENWTYVSDIYPMDNRQTGIYFRPKVIYNEKNMEYVLWINYLAPAWSPLASYPKSMLTVATSKTPQGPFITQT
jgi:sucrose-6-phosphate hydrolase SacC (GH32 family)